MPRWVSPMHSTTGRCRAIGRRPRPLPVSRPTCRRTWSAFTTWIPTAAGKRPRRGAMHGSPTWWPAGPRTVSATGCGFSRGVGRGWTRNRGVLRRFITAVGPIGTTHGAGFRVGATRAPCTPRRRLCGCGADIPGGRVLPITRAGAPGRTSAGCPSDRRMCTCRAIRPVALTCARSISPMPAA